MNDDVLALDLRFNPAGSVTKEMEGLAVGLFQLHSRAHKQWSDGVYYQRSVVNGDVLSVELRAAPW